MSVPGFVMAYHEYKHLAIRRHHHRVFVVFAREKGLLFGTSVGRLPKEVEDRAIAHVQELRPVRSPNRSLVASGIERQARSGFRVRARGSYVSIAALDHQGHAAPVG